MSNFEFRHQTRSQLRKKIKIGKEVSQLSFVKLKNMERERGLWKCLLVERTCSLTDSLLESLEEEDYFLSKDLKAQQLRMKSPDFRLVALQKAELLNTVFLKNWPRSNIE
ncbi:43164_t:CDS:2 [Gigaspora margarita]|uniref:43164_t:CDS:1 n=1 Tax=Gigaspora margarita TaxID=4874 RepID=A0ABN7V127_GIGMA|nr:43164_t:CDS:2 [Gigaspora margarita]